MRRHLAVTAALALLGAGACSKPAPVPADELTQDLARANGGGLELAPRSGGLQVVSDVELGRPPQKQSAFKAAPTPQRRPVPKPAPRAIRVAAAPVPAPEPTRAPVPEPAPTPAPERAPEPEMAPMPAPRPRPAATPTQKEPPGGWSSVGDVIRRAPFPIKP
jgi:outer membrane biosynthesis protein TonB